MHHIDCNKPLSTYVNYDCVTSKILSFLPTPILNQQIRTHSFRLRNAGSDLVPEDFKTDNIVQTTQRHINL